MLNKWICSDSVNLWAQIFWLVVLQNGCLLFAIVLIGCSGKMCRRKKQKTDPKSKKTGRTGTTSGTTTSGTSTGNHSSIPNREVSAAHGVFGGDQPDTKVTTTTTEGDTKTGDAGQEKKGTIGAKSKAKKKKKKTEDADEANKKTAEAEEKKAETQEFNHENTLRIEMCDDDHTKTRTTDVSACMDAYDPNNPNPDAKDEGQGKLEKKQSQHGKKNKSAKQKGKGKKKKDTTVQSVECQPADDKEKVQNSKKSKKSRKSRKSLKGPQPSSLNDKVQQKSGPDDKKMMTMIEDEGGQKEKKDASIKK